MYSWSEERMREEENAAFAAMVDAMLKADAREQREIERAKEQHYRRDTLDIFGFDIACVRQDAEKCDFSIVRNDYILVGYLSREDVNRYTQCIRDRKLDVTEIRLKRVDRL